MEPAKRICFLINSLEGGGAERVLSILIEGLHTRFTITLLLLDDREVLYEIPKAVNVVTFGASNFISAAFRVGLFLKKEKCRTVVSFLNRSNYVNVISNLIFSHKTIISERNVPSRHFSGKKVYGFLNKKLVSFLYRFADRIISVSEGVRRDLIDNFDIDERKILTINNPCDLDRISRLGESALPEFNYICAAGRLTRQKRFDLLIRSYFKSESSLNLLILGEGEERPHLESLVQELNLEGKVRLIGHQKNPYGYIRQSDFFVLASDYEGFPNVLIEAMALGKAVIATDCLAGPKEILFPGKEEKIESVVSTECGFLVPVGDENLLASAIRQLGANKGQRKQFESKARLRAADYNVGKIVQRYHDELLKQL